MNKLFGILTLFVGLNAHALSCTLFGENPNKPGEFDQLLTKNASIEVLKDGAVSQNLLVKLNGDVIENFDFTSIKSTDLESLDQAVLASVHRNVADKTLSLTVSRIDASNTKHLMSALSMALGTEGQLLSIINFAAKVSFICFN